MSTHPNAILMAVLTPDGLARATMRNILGGGSLDDAEVAIGIRRYNALVMESEYDKGYQISANEGDLVFFEYVTYGYGETISWSELEKAKAELEAWANSMSQQHNCTYKIMVTANYW